MSIDKYKKQMEIIKHTRPNFMATVRALGVGDDVTFPFKVAAEPYIRVLAARMEGTFRVNKTDEGIKVTRIA